MGKRTNCCVPGCSNVRGKVPIPYYRIPKHPNRRRQKFIQLIGRDWRWKPVSSTRICAAHFANGAKSNDPQSLSYLPSVDLPFQDKCKKNDSRRRKTRTSTKTNVDTEKQLRDNPLFALCEAAEIRQSEQQQQLQKTEDSSVMSTQDVTDHDAAVQKAIDGVHDGKMDNVEMVSTVYFDHDYVFGHWKVLSAADHEEVTTTIRTLRRTNMRLNTEISQLKSRTLGLDLIRESDENCQRYTGLPNFGTFRSLFEFLEDDAKKLVYWDGKKTLDKQRTSKGRVRSKMTLEEEFFITLVRLKLNMPLFDLSRQTGVTSGHLSNTIVTWVHFLAEILEELIDIPEYKDIEALLSDKAKEFQGTRIIVDCTEWYTQRPSHLLPRKQIWSNYKHENTFKWLVGVSLKGAICYVSEAWGGRASDKCITNGCGLLDRLNSGDGLMADRGFDMETELSSRGINLHIPAFKGANRAQLTSHEVHYSRRVAAVRIQVERAIGKMKAFHIFDKKLPLSMSNSADAIFKTCAYLTNFQTPVLKAKACDISL